MTFGPRYKVGDKIGGVYLVHKVLRGGMGEVYICRHLYLRTPYALKTFRQEFLTNRNFRETFDKEITTWIALGKHQNIVRCMFVETFNNQPFMFLELIVSEQEEYGADLRNWLRRGPINPRLALDFTIDICRGLAHAGEKQPGIVHRDLKPDNVLVGSGGIAKITDFGLAKIVGELGYDMSLDASESGERQSLISRGRVVGTPAYMAPEQWLDEELDVRTDLYAVGCILYELLTGRLLFRAASLEEFRRQHLQASAVKLAGRDLLHSQLNEVLARCLSRHKEERFGSAQELLGELSHLYRAQFSEPPREIAFSPEMNSGDYQHRGNTFIHLRRYEEALESFDESIRLDPSAEETYADRSRLYQILHRYEEALVDINRAIELAPDFALAICNRANVYGQMGRYEEALADYDRAIELDPAYPRNYSNRAAIYLKQLNFAQALEDVDRALRLDPQYAHAFYTRGLIRFAQSQFDHALEDFDKAVELDPYYPQAYLYRGRVRHELGRDDNALTDYNAAISLDPNLKDAYTYRGALYAHLKNYQAALDDLNVAVRANPEDEMAYGNRGIVDAELNRLEEALEDFDQAIKLTSGSTKLFTDRGKVLAKLRRFPEAIADYDKAVRLAPDNDTAFYNRGNVYFRLGDVNRALADYTRSIAINPIFAQAHVNLGSCCVTLGREQEALVEFELASRLNPNLAEPYFNTGALHLNRGDLHGAISHLHKAATLGHPRAAQALAEVTQYLSRNNT